jgi:hypothetical protein
MSKVSVMEFDYCGVYFMDNLFILFNYLCDDGMMDLDE